MHPDSLMPPTHEEAVYFENWRDLGCQFIVNGKEVLTLNTPESSLSAGNSPVFVEDWVTSEEFCRNLTSVLQAFGASNAILDKVEREQQSYLERQVEGPTTRTADLLRGVEKMAAELQN